MEQIPHRVQRSWSTIKFAIIYCSFCVLFVPLVSVLSGIPCIPAYIPVSGDI
jgi:hypothetical protein